MKWIFYGTELLPPNLDADEDWFTLNQTSRSLAMGAHGDVKLIARTLLKDFKDRRFDGPRRTDWTLSEEGEDFVDVPNPEVIDDIDLRWRTRWRDYLGRERWVLVDSESAQAGFAEETDVGTEGDGGDTFWLCKEAINRWCNWHDVPRLSSWPPPEDSFEAYASKDVILRVLRSIGDANSKRWKLPELHDRVAQTIGKRVSRRLLDDSKKIVANEGRLQLYPRGNPGKR
jgi:hypothetical protein